MASGATGQNIFFPFNSPTLVGGCILWLDGADPAGTGVAPANNSPVSPWVDKSRNGNSAIVQGGTPRYSSSTNSVSFDGGSYFSSPITNQVYTYFAVFNITQNSPLFARNLLYSYDGFFPNYLGTTYLARSDSLWYSQTATFTGSTQYLVAIQYDSNNNIYLWQNGSLTPVISTTTSGTITANQLAIGYKAYGGVYTTGNEYEIIMFNSAISTYQQQQVEGYLAWKWGLVSSLPSGHPYKNQVPTATPTINSSQITTIPLYIIKNRAFAPPQIAGLKLWFDAQDPYGTGTPPGNGTLTTWNDKSGLRNNGTASAGGVTYNTTNLGGYPAFIFTNSQYFLGSTSISGSNLTIFSVFSLANQTTGASGRIIGLAASGQNDYNNSAYMALARQSGLSFGPYRNGTYTGNTLSAYDTPTIIEAWYDGTYQYSVTNGGLTPLSNAFTGNFSVSAYAIGDNTNTGDVPNGPLYGSIGEIIIYSTSLSLPQRQQVEGYLAWKWGRQTNLPPTHPYYVYNLYNAFPATTPANTSSVKAIFKPTNYGGCQLWLDAWDPFGNGSRQKSPLTLTRWVDKSTNARHANMFNGSSISYSPNAFNNKPALLFTQTQNMSSAAAAGTFPSAFTFFIIYQRTGGGTYDALVTRTLVNIAAPLELFTNISNGNLAIGIGNGTAYSAYNTTAGSNFTNVTTPSLYYANVSAANGFLDAFNFARPVDRSSGSLTGVYYGDTATGIYLGTRADSYTTLTASVAEIIVYNTTPTDPQRQTIEGYLAWKWGLQANLPAGHPYQNYPPPPQ